MAKVSENNGVFTSFWIKWFIAITDAIFLVEANADKLSLNHTYLVIDVSSPFFIPIAAGIINIDTTVKTMQIHKTPQLPGATLPDLTDLTGIELFFDRTKFISIDPLTITDNTTYWTITWTSSGSLGTINATDACTVTFHW